MKEEEMPDGTKDLRRQKPHIKVLVLGVFNKI
jgi:hypothetical protein